MSARQTRFYLDKRAGKAMGVCAGIADYTGTDATLVRVATVLFVVFATGGVGALAYLMIGLLAEDRPRELEYDREEDRRFWQGVRARPANSIRDVRATFRDIDRRLADVEASVTTRNRRLADEIEALR